MACTQSFAQVVQTFVDQDNKAERRSLTLLLGTISQRLSDDFSANCRSLGETRDHAESHMSLARQAKSGRQQGDPAKAGKALAQLLVEPNPPAHLLLGADAAEYVRKELDALTEEFVKWRPLTMSTDFDAKQ